MNVSFEQRDEYPQRVLTFESSASDATLTLEAGPDDHREVDSYAARVRGTGIDATTGVYTYGTDGLPEYFRDLADHWQGWSGVRSWSSLEGQLSLDGEHDRLGTVRLVATLTPDTSFTRWTVGLVLAIDAGGLEHAGASVARFFALPAAR